MEQAEGLPDAARAEQEAARAAAAADALEAAQENIESQSTGG